MRERRAGRFGSGQAVGGVGGHPKVTLPLRCTCQTCSRCGATCICQRALCVSGLSKSYSSLVQCACHRHEGFCVGSTACYGRLRA